MRPRDRTAELVNQGRLASSLLSCGQRFENVWKLKRKPTISDEFRIKSLEERLDAAVAESQRMRRELDILQRRDHPAQPPRDGKLRRRRRPTEMDTYNPDDTVN